MVYGWIIRDQQEKHNTISETDIAGISDLPFFNFSFFVLKYKPIC
jgi:hypothetical protein